MKNIVGQDLNQLVGNTANSSGEGPTHLERDQLIWRGTNSYGKK